MAAVGAITLHYGGDGLPPVREWVLVGGAGLLLVESAVLVGVIVHRAMLNRRGYLRLDASGVTVANWLANETKIPCDRIVRVKETGGLLSLVPGLPDTVVVGAVERARIFPGLERASAVREQLIQAAGLEPAKATFTGRRWERGRG